jgi:hypothetical protein
MLGRRSAEQDDDRCRPARTDVGSEPGVESLTRRPQPDQSPAKTTSKRNPTPVCASTVAWTDSARRRTSVAVPCRSLTMKLACFSETTAPPERKPLSPSPSIIAPAEGPSAGLRKTLPAEG